MHSLRKNFGILQRCLFDFGVASWILLGGGGDFAQEDQAVAGISYGEAPHRFQPQAQLFDGGIALDLFAGSGGLGIECLSRGVENVIFVEKDRKAFSIVKENVEKCRYNEQAEAFCNDAVRAVKALLKRDVVFDVLLFDPPYHKREYYDLVRVLIEHGKVDTKGVIMCEHATDVTLPESYGEFVCVRRETYSSTVVSIYRVAKEEGE